MRSIDLSERAKVGLSRLGFVFRFHFLLPEISTNCRRQRVAVARPIDPPVILADEPTGSLDRVSTALTLLRDERVTTVVDENTRRWQTCLGPRTVMTS